MVVAASLVPIACSSDGSDDSSDAGSSALPTTTGSTDAGSSALPTTAGGSTDAGDRDPAPSTNGGAEPTDAAPTSASTSSQPEEAEQTDDTSTSEPTATATGGAVPEWTYVELDSSFYLYARDVGDVTGDGRPDVVGVQEGDTTIEVFASPDWQRSTLISITGDDPYPRADDFKLADIDGDGDRDVVTRLGPGPADDGPGAAAWYDNLGDGRGFEARVMGTSPEYVKDIVVDDVDLDGRLDVVMRMDSSTQIWFQEPSGWSDVVIPHPAHEGMDVGDLNGDGRPDIVLNGFWLETPGSPDAAREADNYEQHDIDEQWWGQEGDWTANSAKVAVADIDGDGRNDVVLSNSEQAGSTVTWYRSDATDGSGPWTAHTVVDIDFCHNLQAADFDGDGTNDLLVGGMISSDQRGLRVLYNDGTGEEWSESVVQEDGSYSAEIGDVDDDGDLDIVGILNWDSAPSWIYRNESFDSAGN